MKTVSTIEVSQLNYDYGGGQLPVLRVVIESLLYGEHFYPFDASAVEIYREICPECYLAAGFPSCGLPDYKVFRNETSTLVHWLFNSEDELISTIKNVEKRILVFQARYYEQQLGGCISTLPVLRASELNNAWKHVPKYTRKLGLFTLPEIDQDSQGRAMLELLDTSSFLDDAKLANTPKKSVVIHVGIDLPGTPILELEWGYDAGCYQLRFPFKLLADCWLSSNLIQSYGEQYLGQLFQTG